jgi:hypothetical protein
MITLEETYDTPATSYGEFLDRIAAIDEALWDLSLDDPRAIPLLKELGRVTDLGYVGK